MLLCTCLRRFLADDSPQRLSFLYFTVQLPVGRLNLLSVLSPYWPLIWGLLLFYITAGSAQCPNNILHKLIMQWETSKVSSSCGSLSSIHFTQNCLVQHPWDHNLTVVVAVDDRLIDNGHTCVLWNKVKQIVKCGGEKGQFSIYICIQQIRYLSSGLRLSF